MPVAGDSEFHTATGLLNRPPSITTQTQACKPEVIGTHQQEQDNMFDLRAARAQPMTRDHQGHDHGDFQAPQQGSFPGSPSASFGARCLARMLDVVDYGMLMVEAEARVVFANQVARAELDDQHPLFMAGGELRARATHDMAALRQALFVASARGAQSMLTLADLAGEGIIISVVPLAEAGHATAVLIVFGKRRVCENLSIDAFGRQHGLTTAETRVLKLLCSGCRPRSIAIALGVTLNTVRTQIKSIRSKTGSPDIGELVQRVARLPPLACRVRAAV